MTNQWSKNLCFLIAIDCHRLSSIASDYHRLPAVIDCQRLSSIVINSRLPRSCIALIFFSSFLLLNNKSISNIYSIWAFMVSLHCHLVDSQNNLTHISLGCFCKPEQKSRGKYLTTTGTELPLRVDY